MRRALSRVGAITLSLLLISASAVASIACPDKSVCSLYKESAAIVVGRVTRLELVKSQSGKPLYELAHVKVTETLKGPLEEEVLVFNKDLDYPEIAVSDSDYYDANLKVGKSYLIYGAQEDPTTTRVPGVLYIDPCDRPYGDLLDKARILTIRKYVKRGMPSEGVYEGQVVYEQRSGPTDLPLRGATVRITGENFAVDKLVDRDGGFRFFNLRPGQYKVSVIARDGTPLHKDKPLSLSYSMSDEKESLACGTDKFTTEATGLIDGSVELPDDELSADTVLRSEYGESSDEGAFSYEELLPASYKLLISSVYSDRKRLIYAHRPLLATINLKPGQQIENAEYRFTPPRFLKRPSTYISLKGVPRLCREMQPELLVTYQNGVATTFPYFTDQELIFEKSGSVHLKAQCWASSGDVLVSETVKVDPIHPPVEVTLWFRSEEDQ